MYPGLVYGFLHFLKAKQEGEARLAPNDIALTASGEPVTAIRCYHDVSLGLAGRRLVRDDYTRYEAVGLGMVIPRGETRNQLLAAFLRLIARFNLPSSSRRCIRCTIYAMRTRLHRSQDYGDTNGRRIHRSCEHLL